jgi:hypothetical protein
MLASALGEQGFLGTLQDHVYVANGCNIALGDIGFKSKGDLFEVIDNIHDLLTPTNGDAPTWDLTWKSGPGLSAKNEEILEHSGKPYRRQRHV